MRYVDLGKSVEQRQQKIMNDKLNPKSRFGKKKAVFFGVFLALAVILGFIYKEQVVAALFDPVSIVSNISSANLNEADGRTNILVLGVDKRSIGTEYSVLTDTLLFASIGRIEKNVAMISLPRDLWVKADAGKGTHYMKINSVYAVDGVGELEKIIEEVLGMPIHYYVVVDFGLFKNAIDILGGVEVEVDNAFTDYEYPIEGNEAATCGRTQEEIEKMENVAISLIYPCRYETVRFEAGKQTMNGDTALKYVRSRKGDNGEGTDFARSRRQQKVIMAIKNKALNLSTILDLSKLKELYDLYSKNVDTNIAFDDVKGFYLLSQKIDFSSVRSIVLDDRSGAEEGGLLYHPTDVSLYGGAYVLVPKVGNYSQLHAYVQRYIFGE